MLQLWHDAAPIGHAADDEDTKTHNMQSANTAWARTGSLSPSW